MDQKRKIRKIFNSITVYSLEFFFLVYVYFFIKIYSNEYSPKAKIFSLRLLIMTVFGLRLVLCLTRDEER